VFDGGEEWPVARIDRQEDEEVKVEQRHEEVRALLRARDLLDLLPGGRLGAVDRREGEGLE